MKLKRYAFVFMLLAIVGSLLIACAAPQTAEEEMPEEEAPAAEEEMMELGGDILIDGSSTVGPISQAVAEEFIAVYPDVRPSVGISGTGGGFEKFCAGETDISDASRPIKDEEAEECAGNGIEYTEFYVGIDALAVMVSLENDWVPCLTPQQLGEIFAVSSEVVTWADIDPSWPAEEIQPLCTHSVTYSSSRCPRDGSFTLIIPGISPGTGSCPPRRCKAPA